MAVVEAWNIPVYNNYNSPYNDIPDGYGLLPWINAAYNMGIIGGTNFSLLILFKTMTLSAGLLQQKSSSFGNVNESVLNNSNNYFLPSLLYTRKHGSFQRVGTKLCLAIMQRIAL
ncbi:MAG: hypothetical protein R2728_15975 [Chitinophagales bacterium]